MICGSSIHAPILSWANVLMFAAGKHQNSDVVPVMARGNKCDVLVKLPH